jgi:CBS domain containing-hemolysin-like protein
MVLLVLVCMVVSFGLAGTEAALLSVSRVRVRHAASEGDRRARRLMPILEERDAMLGAVTVANHVSALTAFLLIAWQLVERFGGVGYVWAFVLGLPIFLVGLEIIPKKLFRRYPFRLLRLVLPLLAVVSIFRPLFRGLARRVSLKDDEASPGVPAESVARNDLMELSGKLSQQGQISPEASKLIGKVLVYRKQTVGEVMVPLRHSVALSPDVPVHVAVELARSHSLESVPVLGEKGDFVGVFEPASCGPHLPQDRMVRQYMRPLEQIREEEPLLLALQRLRKRGRTVALVVNRQGEPSGIVTEEALLRPLLAAD